jgi:hypothetical protein
MDTRDGATYFAERVWGVSIRYDLGEEHRGPSIARVMLPAAPSLRRSPCPSPATRDAGTRRA